MFRFLTAGDSHGTGLVAVVEGVPCRSLRSESCSVSHLYFRVGFWIKGKTLPFVCEDMLVCHT